MKGIENLILALLLCTVQQPPTLKLNTAFLAIHMVLQQKDNVFPFWGPNKREEAKL